MDCRDIKIESFPAGLMVDNFIHGIGSYSYEDYLIEFLNFSRHFLSKSNGEQYSHAKSESQGENDSISQNYQIDFKLLASKSLLQAKSIFDLQVTCDENAGVFWNSAPRVTKEKKGYRSIPTTRIFAALRCVAAEDLDDIDHIALPESVRQDLRAVKHTAETNKNLLYLFPYNFYFEKKVDVTEGLRLIIAGINDFFTPLFHYRTRVVPNRDTYFTFTYAHQLVILKWACDCFEYVEAIWLDESPLFMKLMNLAGDELI